MSCDDSGPASDRFLQYLIRSKARKFRGKRDAATRDASDLEQELWLRLLRRLGGLDLARGSLHAYATVVIETALANVLRDRHAPRRDDDGAVSLSSPVENPDGPPTTLADAVGKREKEARLGVRTRDAAELSDLRRDVASLLESLPKDLRDIAEGVMRHDAVADVARALGLPRTTAVARLRQIRLLFEKAGLGDDY